jgi:hypothetical protein
LTLGRWKLNVAESTFLPGSTPPRGITVERTTTPEGVRYTEHVTRADGSVQQIESLSRYDGKEYPVTGMRTVDSVSSRRIDAHTVNVTLKRAGSVVWSIRSVVSRDSNKMTVTETGILNATPVKKIQVFDRQ